MSDSSDNPTWADNAALWSALSAVAKSGQGDNCCDDGLCCLFCADIASSNAPKADGLPKPLTFSQAAELERKAGMFERAAATIREALSKYPPSAE
jgi:hypothetical protein